MSALAVAAAGEARPVVRPVPAVRDDEGVAAEAEKRQGRRTVRGMVPSLAVVLLAAGFIYLFVPHDEDIDPVKPVGYHVELESARRAAPYPVLAPAGLPDSWRATSVRYDGDPSRSATWHLGFVTPNTEYAAVEQSDAARSEKYVADVTQGARKTGATSRIDGVEWTRYEGEKYDALVREVPAAGDGKGRPAEAEKGEAETGARKDGARGHTVVVTGTASFEQLGRLAAALSDGDGEGGKDEGKGRTR
ncbi:hypothetical protein GCM10012287_34820 [Streptomyces daqingensis]|uniref:DUF4245 domain-containing protein n=1 Tax=Streptomyces daqingensis TaxID=1472640 RepID=A0ABQ2MI53_9ACTN|nr:hypothetical protein GCM10012287_34820 [Streptomyces daqingensis]